jgi:hypothetical protein
MTQLSYFKKVRKITIITGISEEENKIFLWGGG